MTQVHAVTHIFYHQTSSDTIDAAYTSTLIYNLILFSPYMTRVVSVHMHMVTKPDEFYVCNFFYAKLIVYSLLSCLVKTKFHL